MRGVRGIVQALAAAAAVLSAACSSSESTDPELVAYATAGTPGGGGGPTYGSYGPVKDGEPLPRVMLFDLRAAPFPGTGHPDVAVHVPVGFDATNHPGLVVFFHGFENCVANVVGSVDTECTPGAGTRAAMHLVDQLDAAHVNAILVAVQLKYDQRTGDPGQLATQGDFRALVHELFTEHLDGLLGHALDAEDFDPVVVGTHSGGYQAAATVLANGGLPHIREVDLYDSLYGETAIFDDWVKSGMPRFDPSRPDAIRWMDVYTSTGGTEANSQSMATTVAGWASDAGASSEMMDDRTTAMLAASAYAHPILFKLTSLAHDDVPRYYFQRFAETGFLTPLR